MKSSFFNWILSAFPIFSILLSMFCFKWGGFKSDAFSWILFILISIIFFGAGLPIIFAAQIKRFFLVLDVLLVIWSALFFHLTPLNKEFIGI
jgi:L-lactate permease